MSDSALNRFNIKFFENIVNCLIHRTWVKGRDLTVKTVIYWIKSLYNVPWTL
jgi:hypothetical protein